MPNSYKSVAYTTTGSGSNEDVYTCGVVASVIKSLSIYNPNASNAYTVTVKLYKSSNTTSYEVNYQSIAAKTAWNVMPSDGAINLQNGDKIQVVTSQAGLVVSLSYLESSVSVSGINLAAIADVSDVAATDNQVLTWDSATGLATWETPTSGGITDVVGTSPISVSGTTTKTVSISAATQSAAGSMSSADKTKLDGIATGAEVNVNADWNATSGDAQILNKPTLATVATSGSYDDLSNKPTIVSSVTGTAPIVSSGGTTPAISISAATTSTAGSMSAADKTKLDGIAAGAEVNVNADWNAVSGDAEILNKPTIVSSVTGTSPIVSSGGTTPAISITAATTTVAGSMSAADKSKLDGIEAGAQVNDVTSVNTQVGAVVLDTDDVLEGTTNKYFTDARADARTLAEKDQTLTASRTIDLSLESLSIVDGATPVAGFGLGVQALHDILRLFSNTATAPKLELYEGGAANNYVAFKAPNSLSANTTYTLPAADGTSGQVFSTNGSGTTSWVTKKVTQVTGKTVATGAWSLVSGVYEASISDSAILSTSIVDVVPDNGSASTIRTAQMLPRTDSSTGSVKIYSTNAPAASITVTLNIFDL